MHRAPATRPKRITQLDSAFPRSAALAWRMGSEPACCPRCSGVPGAAAQTFGVRSYLHLFYEDCAFSGPLDDNDDDGDQDSKDETSTQDLWRWLLWRASLAAGILLAVTGAVALAVGFLLPPRIEGFGDGELLVVDEHAIGHNGALLACQLAGAVLLGLGTFILLGCALTWGTGYHDDGGKQCWARKPQESWPIPNVSPIQTMLPISLSQTFSIQP